MHEMADFTDDEKMVLEIFAKRLVDVMKEVSTLRIAKEADPLKKVALLVTPLIATAWGIIHEAPVFEEDEKEEAMIKAVTTIMLS